jgi:hypothetical protein
LTHRTLAIWHPIPFVRSSSVLGWQFYSMPSYPKRWVSEKIFQERANVHNNTALSFAASPVVSFLEQRHWEKNYKRIAAKHPAARITSIQGIILVPSPVCVDVDVVQASKPILQQIFFFVSSVQFTSAPVRIVVDLPCYLSIGLQWWSVDRSTGNSTPCTIPVSFHMAASLQLQPTHNQALHQGLARPVA